MYICWVLINYKLMPIAFSWIEKGWMFYLKGTKKPLLFFLIGWVSIN